MNRIIVHRMQSRGSIKILPKRLLPKVFSVPQQMYLKTPGSRKWPPPLNIVENQIENVVDVSNVYLKMKRCVSYLTLAKDTPIYFVYYWFKCFKMKEFLLIHVFGFFQRHILLPTTIHYPIKFQFCLNYGRLSGTASFVSVVLFQFSFRSSCKQRWKNGLKMLFIAMILLVRPFQQGRKRRNQPFD